MRPGQLSLPERLPVPYAFIIIATIGLLGSTATAFAHHSIAAEFDVNHRIMLTGTVTKVEWTNPHTFFYIDVKDPKTATVVKWACELGSPNMLAMRGWKPDTLKVGMTVSLTGTQARDGSHKVIARNIIADGVRLHAWPSEEIQ
jgi:hypothetical protein